MQTLELDTPVVLIDRGVMGEDQVQVLVEAMTRALSVLGVEAGVRVE